MMSADYIYLQQVETIQKKDVGLKKNTETIHAE